MKIDKAIEYLQADLLQPNSYLKKTGAGDKLDFQDAEQLGIEALKREQYHRSCYPNQSQSLLPGETLV